MNKQTNDNNFDNFDDDVFINTEPSTEHDGFDMSDMLATLEPPSNAVETAPAEQHQQLMAWRPTRGTDETPERQRLWEDMQAIATPQAMSTFDALGHNPNIIVNIPLTPPFDGTARDAEAYLAIWLSQLRIYHARFSIINAKITAASPAFTRVSPVGIWENVIALVRVIQQQNPNLADIWASYKFAYSLGAISSMEPVIGFLYLNPEFRYMENPQRLRGNIEYIKYKIALRNRANEQNTAKGVVVNITQYN